jgi:hypothetical protein
MRRAAVLLCAAAACAEETACAANEDPGNPVAGLEVSSEVEQKMQTALLQSRTAHVPPADKPLDEIASLLRSAEGAAMSATERADMIKPVAWFHIEKTGTSFANTIYHTPAVCPSMPADSYVSSAVGEYGTWDHEAWGRESEMCPGGFSKSYQSTLSFWLHEGLSMDTWLLNKGHFVTMLRQPEQRILSHYGNELKEIQWMRYPTGERVWPYTSSTPSAREFAEVMAGCSVKQLTLDDYDPCYRVETPTPEDVTLAINRLRQGFAFVGITDHWDLSICLFRAMFGGECNSLDLMNTRPFNGTTADTEDYDTSVLEGWTDDRDGQLYKAGVELFKKSLSLYSVDETSCASLCGQLA